MTATHRKVLGAAVIAIAALGTSAAFMASAFAADTESAKLTMSASSSRSHSHGIINFEAQPFVVKVAQQFQQVFTPEDHNLRLRGGAKLVNGSGFILGGGSGTRNASGDVTENLRGTVTYTAPQSYTVPQSYTIQITDFKLEATSDITRAELVGDVKVTQPARQAITVNGLNLLDLQLTEGKVSLNGSSEAFKNVPALLSNQAAQIAAQVAPGLLRPDSFIADTDFSVPAP